MEKGWTRSTRGDAFSVAAVFLRTQEPRVATAIASDTGLLPSQEHSTVAHFAFGTTAIVQSFSGTRYFAAVACNVAGVTAP